MAGWLAERKTEWLIWLIDLWKLEMAEMMNDPAEVGRGTVGPVLPLNSSSFSQQVYLQHRKCPSQFARPYIPMRRAPASGASFLACSTLPSTIHLQLYCGSILVYTTFWTELFCSRVSRPEGRKCRQFRHGLGTYKMFPQKQKIPRTIL